jgi:predicted metalloendopeptidase
MLARFGETDAQGQAKRILALETRLAQIQWDNVALRDREKNYNKGPVSELGRLAPPSTGRLPGPGRPRGRRPWSSASPPTSRP